MEYRCRPVRDDDAEALLDLVGSVYSEYPGCVLDPDGVDADLTEPATSIAGKDGEMIVVADAGGEIVACVGWAPTGPGTVELKRLYVASGARRQGLGRRLVEWVEERARAEGADSIELWSDSRFDGAHRLYEALGYERQPETRDLHDPSDTTEYRYLKTGLSGAER